MYSLRKKKNVAGENAFHSSMQVVALSVVLAVLARRGAAVVLSPLPATTPTLPPLVTHAGNRLNTGSGRRAALMLQP